MFFRIPLQIVAITAVISLPILHLTITCEAAAPNEPHIVSRWDHNPKGVGGGVITFWSNGHVNRPKSNVTWELKGNKLTIRWPDKNAVDHCIMAPDGRSYRGKSEAGIEIVGKRLSDSDLKKEKTAAVGRPDKTVPKISAPSKKLPQITVAVPTFVPMRVESPVVRVRPAELPTEAKAEPPRIATPKPILPPDTVRPAASPADEKASVYHRVEPARTTSEGRLSLFDGKTLYGWHFRDPDGPNCWLVQDGELLCASQPQTQGKNLVTNQIYRDFDLQLEFLLEGAANSGVYLRGLYEIQLIDDKPYSLRPESRCGAIYNKAAPSEEAYLGPGRWNTLTVKMVGQRVTVSMNGIRIIHDANVAGPTDDKQTLNIKDGDPGPIMLQCHPGGRVKFRNISLKRIGDPTREQIEMAVRSKPSPAAAIPNPTVATPDRQPTPTVTTEKVAEIAKSAPSQAPAQESPVTEATPPQAKTAVEPAMPESTAKTTSTIEPSPEKQPTAMPSEVGVQGGGSGKLIVGGLISLGLVIVVLAVWKLRPRKASDTDEPPAIPPEDLPPPAPRKVVTQPKSASLHGNEPPTASSDENLPRSAAEHVAAQATPLATADDDEPPPIPDEDLPPPVPNETAATGTASDDEPPPIPTE